MTVTSLPRHAASERRPRTLAAVDPDPAMLVVNVQIAVPSGTPAADQAVALARRLQALVTDDVASAQVSTTVSVVLDTVESGRRGRTPLAPAPVSPAPMLFREAPAARPAPVASPEPALAAAETDAELVLYPERRLALIDG